MANYSDDQRKAARELYATRGSRHASEALHIPQRTIQQWASTEGWATRLASVSASGEELAQAQRMGWALRRQGIADDLAEAAAETVGFYRQRLRSGKIYGLLDLMRSASLAIERAAEMTAGLGGGAEAGEIPAEQAVAGIKRILDAIEPRAGTDG